MMKCAVLFLLLACGIASTTACAIGPCEDDTYRSFWPIIRHTTTQAPPRNFMPECVLSEDCPTEMGCVNGRCVKGGSRFFQECPPDCRMPACQCFQSRRSLVSCKDGEIKVAGLCFPHRPYARTTCSMDLQCPDNRKCVDGRCLAVRHLFTTCSMDLQCPDNRKCINGQCLAVRRLFTTCSMDLQCPDNRKCINGQCLAVRRLAARCTDSVECPDNRQCLNGSCVVIG